MTAGATACGDDDTSESNTSGTAPDVTSDEGVAPAASDRGVTATEIRIGFALLDVDGLRSAGLLAAFGIREDASAAIDALVAAANEAGGIQGRTIVAVKRPVSLLDPADARAKCLQFTQDDEVFAVIDSITFNDPAARSCLTVENQTPLLGNAGSYSTDELEASSPFLVTTGASASAQMRNLVLVADQEGFFDEGSGFERLGVYSTSCDRAVFEGDGSLQSFLESVGITDYSEFVHDCNDRSKVQADAETALLQFQQDGVTNVFLLSDASAHNAFLGLAEQQDFHPKYFATDFAGTASNAGTRQYPPGQWNGTVAVTPTYQGVIGVDAELPDATKECSDILVNAGLPGITDTGRDIEILLMCEELSLLIAAASNAPVNITRELWAEGLAEVGDFAGAYTHLGHFDEGIHAGGGDSVALIEWRADCTCYHQIASFAPVPTD